MPPKDSHADPCKMRDSVIGSLAELAKIQRSVTSKSSPTSCAEGGGGKRKRRNNPLHCGKTPTRPWPGQPGSRAIAGLEQPNRVFQRWLPLNSSRGGGRSYCRWAHRFPRLHHASYTAVFRAPPAIGTAFQSASGLRNGTSG